MLLLDLRAGYDSLHLELEGKPSRYRPAVASAGEPGRTIGEEINDSLPDHFTAPPDVQISTPPASANERAASVRAKAA